MTHGDVPGLTGDVLGPAGAGAVLLAAAAGLLWSGSRVPLRRLAGRVPATGVRAPGPAQRASGRYVGERSREWLARWAPLLVGVVVSGLAVVAGGFAAVVGGVAAAALVLPLRRRRAAAARTSAALEHDLTRAAGLLAACLDAGAAPVDAVLVVAEVLDGPGAGLLARVGCALRLGVEPATAWSPATACAGVAGRLARACVRAAETGAPLAATVAALADDEQERARWRAEAAARRAGVRVVGPLAACFLPAFVLLGVVPVVASVASDLLGGLR